MTNQGSEPLRCVALVTVDPNTRTPTDGGGYITTDMMTYQKPCGGPVIETEGCTECGHDSHTAGEVCIDCLAATYRGHEGWPHDHVAPLVHVEQDGPCTAMNSGNINLDAVACGRPADHFMHRQEQCSGCGRSGYNRHFHHDHVPRIIPDSELHAVEVER